MDKMVTLTDSQILSAPTIRETHLDGTGGLKLVKRGKVRDLYSLRRGGEEYLALVTTDRISAYDKVLPRDVPTKGQLLTGASVYAFENMADIMPNHLAASPHPNIMIGRRAERVPIEFVLRWIFTGSAWRNYQGGKRNFFGYNLPNGLRENQMLASPIFTPTTKAEVGHDIDLEDWQQFVQLFGGDEKLAKEAVELGFSLFDRGMNLAGKNGGYLADTKFEMGILDGGLVLVDEALTPDSSRYMFQTDYHRLYDSNAPSQEWDAYWKDKELVRKWLARERKWTGQDGPLPEIPDATVLSAVRAYNDGYKVAVGREFGPQLSETSQDSMIRALSKTGWMS